MNLPMDVNSAPFARPLTEIRPQPQQQKYDHHHSGCGDVKLSSRIDSTNISSQQQQQQQQRRLWWQKSIVKRSLPVIEKEVNNLISSSPFLQQQYVDDTITKQRNMDRGIAMFHRNEIVTGESLGKGGFSQVMEIVAFQLLPEISSECTIEEQKLRQQYVTTVQTDRGMYRYCVKYLQETLVRKPDDFKLAASDLAIEAVTLSVLDHPNIISVRGLPIHNIQAYKNGQYDGYFIVMDRLSTTLDRRIEEWKTHGTTKTDVTATTLREKMTCALQLALAIQYIHTNRLLYRDLKPQNIGFSLESNEVQLFDFGLCRELPTISSDTKNITNDDDEVYEMSGVGTRRYMAPEIVVAGSYNQKVDVYSWSMVFYELLTTTKPYATYTTDEHTTHACHQNVRPILPLSYPYDIHTVLQHAWNANIKQRYTIHEICKYLQLALVRTSVNNSEKNTHHNNNNELCITNHDSLMSKEYDLPNSPTGVLDFPSTAAIMLESNFKPADSSFQKAQDTLYQRMIFQTNNAASSVTMLNYNHVTAITKEDNYESINNSSIGKMMRLHDSIDTMLNYNHVTAITKEDDYARNNNSSISKIMRLHDSIDTFDRLPDVFATGVISPPPAPKRPPITFVQVPDDVVRTFEFSLSDNDDDGDNDDGVIEELCRIYL